MMILFNSKKNNHFSQLGLVVVFIKNHTNILFITLSKQERNNAYPSGIVS